MRTCTVALAKSGTSLPQSNQTIPFSHDPIEPIMAPTIPKLNETNYPEWSMFMHALLVRRGVADVATGRTPQPAGINTPAVRNWIKKADKALTEIILNVKPSQLPHCRKETAVEVWENLKNIYQSHGFGTCIAFHCCFFYICMSEKQLMASWISNVCHATFLLTEVGAKVDNEDTMLVLTNGLPPSYETLIVNLNTTPESTLTLDYVIQSLLNEKSHQLTASSPGDATALLTYHKAHGKTPIEKITCFLCGKKGHYKSNCLEKEKKDVVEEESASFAF